MDENKKTIWLLSVVSLINDMASKIIVPILPFFILAIGGTGFAVGLVSGVGESVASLFKVVAGYWSDKRNKRKPFVVWGYLGAQVAKLLLAFATVWPHVLILRAAERLGKGIRSAPRDAILAGVTEKKSRGTWFGLQRAFDSGGAILGSLLVFALYYLLQYDYQTIFIIAGVIGLLSVIPLFFVKDTPGKIPDTKKRFVLEFAGLPRQLKLFYAVATIFALGNFSYMFFVLKSQTFFTGLMSVGAPILLYALYNLSYTFLAIPAGKLSDRVGRKPVLMIGYALFGVTAIGFMLAGAIWQLIALFVLFGINYAFVEATERAYVSDLAPADARGTALGSFHTLVSLAALPAGLVAGALWDAHQSYTFAYGAAMAAIAILLFMMSQWNRKKVAQL